MPTTTQVFVAVAFVCADFVTQQQQAKVNQRTVTARAGVYQDVAWHVGKSGTDLVDAWLASHLVL